MARRATWIAAALAALALVPAGAPAQRPVEARVEGAFALVGEVTIARGVRGVRRGQVVRRTWRLDSTCPAGPCRSVTLRRPRAGGTDLVVLARRGRGVYSGRGSFTIPVRCAGRRYRRGGLVPFTIRIAVTRARVVAGRSFATRIDASYANPRRVNRTPCPGGLGRDGASYSGPRRGALPSPPRPAFTFRTADPFARRVAFTGTSRGAAITSWAWDFGDPFSGPANAGLGPAVDHAFSGPGPFAVRLDVLDANGLAGTVTRPVVP